MIISGFKREHGTDLCIVSDGSEGLFFDHFIHGTDLFYVILSILFTSMLSYRFSPNSMILGTMIQGDTASNEMLGDKCIKSILIIIWRTNMLVLRSLYMFGEVLILQ